MPSHRHLQLVRARLRLLVVGERRNRTLKAQAAEGWRLLLEMPEQQKDQKKVEVAGVCLPKQLVVAGRVMVEEWWTERRDVMGSQKLKMQNNLACWRLEVVEGTARRQLLDLLLCCVPSS
jgi:hypothetical protein